MFDLDHIGRGLPFAEALPDLRDALSSAGTAVVQAPPGTGKTTLVPPAVANHVVVGVVSTGHDTTDGGGTERVVVTQPRRVAARSAARRLAALTGTELGSAVGYSVRGDSRVGRDTRVEFVTPGVLVRRLIADPDLPGVGAVVLDEVHERDVESDLAFALLCELRELRDDLPVVAMSATVEADRFARLLDGADGAAGADTGADSSGHPSAPVVDVPAVLHPLEITYAPAPVPRLDARGVTDGFLEHVAAVTADEVAAHGHDTLVFLPGVREIDRVIRALGARLGDTAEILPLHGGLDPAAQDRAVSGRTAERTAGSGARPRVVVSTDLAESSLTVPGVRAVVDACLSREPRRDTARDMTGLVTVSASRDSCVQRAGRAARLGPGRAIRCLTEQEFSRLPSHRAPAIATSDLTTFALDVACWGAPRGEGLALPDAPPVGEISRAESVLRGLGAVDQDGRATDRGRDLARVPADPRHARALLDGAGLVGSRTAAEVVAALASGRRSPGGDLAADLRTLRTGRAPDAGAWQQQARRLEQIERGGDGRSRRGSSDGGYGASDGGRGRSGGGYGASDDRRGLSGGAGNPDDAVGLVVALAHPDRVARRRGDQYTLASGTGAVLPPGSALTGHEWLAVAEVGRASGRAAGETGAVIRAAAALRVDDALDAASHLVDDDETASFSGGALTGRRVRRLGAIELSSTPVRPSHASAVDAVSAAVRAGGLAALNPDDDADTLWRRLALAHSVLGEPWPDVSSDALADRLEEWLGPELATLATGGKMAGRDIGPALRRLLTWPEAGRFDELVPERLTVPSSSSYRVDYPLPDSGDAPVLAVKLQECFGWTTSPRICDGRVPVTVHLLSPAGRPLAVTRDLEFFWREAYPGVRAEMRGRYPKHPWPEDPMSAEPTRHTNRRR
ncbi:ATP-dependent helicase HrpB [Dietzia sp. NCCP-2495]|uniref:ATP-dependent RNA helicase n=1 Tax=Dietzia sp. NCCP-2495 TaxID=2934675 RepID=UPI002232AB4D|nr:ATP-dependent helicase C-terminal domain-containing protein [Dietzia sp. NCCP-2495]GLB63743.1 ATP-dependent helicase HrpB [Dietzia sp. NCCP-2495]